ncbi:MAG: hypothetical protein WCA32_04600 [Chromatiaceae bacterium]
MGWAFFHFFDGFSPLKIDGLGNHKLAASRPEVPADDLCHTLQIKHDNQWN